MEHHTEHHHYKPTESEYKGGADEMYVTYDLEQKTRGGDTALYPKVKRVYIAGEVEGWKVGDFKKKSGREAHGVKIDYVQTRRGYERQGFEAHRGRTTYNVDEATVPGTKQHFTKIAEVPKRATNVRFHKHDDLPERYEQALQNVK